MLREYNFLMGKGVKRGGRKKRNIGERGRSGGALCEPAPTLVPW